MSFGGINETIRTMDQTTGHDGDLYYSNKDHAFKYYDATVDNGGGSPGNWKYVVGSSTSSSGGGTVDVVHYTANKYLTPATTTNLGSDWKALQFLSDWMYGAVYKNASGVYADLHAYNQNGAVCNPNCSSDFVGQLTTSEQGIDSGLGRLYLELDAHGDLIVTLGNGICIRHH